MCPAYKAQPTAGITSDKPISPIEKDLWLSDIPTSQVRSQAFGKQ